MMRRFEVPGRLTFNLRGGIGNQLFIYAAGLVIARNSELPLSLNSSGIDHKELIREFVNSEVELVEHTELMRVRKILSRHGWSKSLPRITELDFITPVGFGDLKLKLEKGQNYIVNGFFQNAGYVEELANTPYRITLSEEPKTPWIKEKNHEMRNEDCILIHLRLGDYLSAQNSIGLLSLEYYEKLVESLQMNDKKIYVVSDDPAGAQHFFETSKRLYPSVIFPPKGLSNLSLLHLFQGANTIITSNSTYSWWGSFLAPNSPKVIIPHPWFRAARLHKEIGTGLQRKSWTTHQAIWRNSQ